MKKIIAAFALLLCAMLCMTAVAELPENLESIEASAFEGDTKLTGVLTLPDGVTSVGSRAFAGTGLHALIVPEGCTSLAADVLAGGSAAYVTLNGAETAVTALTDVPFVFAPEGGAASGASGFYAAETLVVQDGVFFSLTTGEAIPLCAVDSMAAGSEIVLTKLVGGEPLLALDTLVLRGCEGVCFSVPSYLLPPEGVSVSTYDAMTLTAPVADVSECTVGEDVTWMTQVSGAYGDVSYIWVFTVEGHASSLITAEPFVTWSPDHAGTCQVTVTAVDALGDRISASSAGVTVKEPVPVYRALLIGNTYPGTDSQLDGCDTDVYAMRNVLNSMDGTDFAVNLQLNLNASAMQSAIASTFAGARSCDVSLFYYSGHGTSAGSLVGVGNTSISVSNLRRYLDLIPGTKIVILDCCYSGMMIGKSNDAASPAAFNSAVISAFSSFNKDDNLASNGYIVLTACSKNQVSASLSDGVTSFGAFTYGLCYGSGYDEWKQQWLGSLPADTNGDGQITLGEAYSKAVERVNWLKTMVAMEQVAQYYGDTSFVLWSESAVDNSSSTTATPTPTPTSTPTPTPTIPEIEKDGE